MTERMKFVGRLLDGERMVDLCSEYGISRKTGYKIFHRFQEEGFSGLRDQKRAPHWHPNQTDKKVEHAVIAVRKEHPSWGAPKIKSFLERKRSDIKVPAKSTIHAILERNELVKMRRRPSRVYQAKGTDLCSPQAPNKLWCTDFKGQFRMGNRSYCYPLTVTDQFSRYLLGCEALDSTAEEPCMRAFIRLFSEFGLPDAIRSDNGVPFASRSYLGVSKLSLLWIRLGIRLERIAPGHPEQNGCHERMHRTLKDECTKPACKNLLAQQECFDAFRDTYNNDRPHEALKLTPPADIYKPSQHAYTADLDELTYPKHDFSVRVTSCGSVWVYDKFRVFIGLPFGGYRVGVKQSDEGLWQIDFMQHRLGYFDLETQKLQIGINPFLPKSIY